MFSHGREKHFRFFPLVGYTGAVTEGGSLPPHPDLPRYYAEGEKSHFVQGIFDSSAAHYERVEKLMALGSGSWYRRRALRRHGFPHGERGLDVAVGTGLVAREILRLAPNGFQLLGLDPSLGMLQQTRKCSRLLAVAARGEKLPFPKETFSCLTMGYALRHLSDLTVTFQEFHRVLKSGGKLLVLEITPPCRGLGRLLLRTYIRGFTATAAQLLFCQKKTAELWRYFWDTMEACVPPEVVLDSLDAAGFTAVSRFVELGIFSEYTAVKL